MRVPTTLLCLGLCVLGCAPKAPAQAKGQSCPVTLALVQLNYKHQGGVSKPQLQVAFGSHVQRKLSKVTFALLILDGSGTLHPYPEDLVFRDGLDVGKSTLYTWELNADSVDIHRAGETVIVESAEFSDSSTWKDDGSDSCSLTVDYRPK